MCASLDLSKILYAQNLSSFPQGSKTYVVKYIIIAFAGNMDSNARVCINPMLSDYLGRFVCHTGHAYSRTGLTTRM